MKIYKLVENNKSNGAVNVDLYPNSTMAYRSIEVHMSYFRGSMRIMGSIEISPDEDDWFVIHEEIHEEMTDIDNRRFNINASGNFIWMKVDLDNQEDNGISQVQRVFVR